MQVLLTGASGYLGGHLVLALTQSGHRVRALLRGDAARTWIEEQSAEVALGDVCDYASVKRACTGCDALVHAAALRGGGARIHAEQRAVNVEGTSNVLRAAARAGLVRIAHVSSIAAVGCTRDGAALAEDARWTGREQPRLHYVRTKRESEERAVAAARGGVPIVVVNPASMLGPNARTGLLKGHLRAVLDGDTSPVPPGGSSFAHVRDVAQGVVAALERGEAGSRYVLGGEDRTWLEVRAAFAALVGGGAPRGTRPAWVGRVLASVGALAEGLGIHRARLAPEQYRAWGWHSSADSSRARQELGYEPAPLDEVLLEIARGAGEAPRASATA